MLARWRKFLGGSPVRRSRHAQRPVAAAAAQSLEQRVLPAVSLKFDYSQDSGGFFADANRKAVLEHAGKLISANLNDTLAQIRPGGTNSWNATILNPTTGRSQGLGNITVGPDIIVIYVGGRDLTGIQLGAAVTGGYSASGDAAWLNTIKGRGEPGALAATKSDTAPWGGSIAFDTKDGTKARNWFFGKTTNGLGATQYDFLSVALHEISHLLGVYAGNPALSRLVSAGKFNGPNAKAQNGNQAVPVLNNGDHLQEGLLNDGVEVSMDPSLRIGTRKLFSDLDFAVLKDIGWEVTTADDTFHQGDHWLTHIVGTSPATGVQLTRNSQTLENVKDVDFYRVFASAGTRLTVTATPVAGLNTLVRIYDSTPAALKTSANTNAGVADTVTLDVTRSDYYFVAVTSFANNGFNANTPNSGPGGQTGTYNLKLEMKKVPVVALTSTGTAMVASVTRSTSTAAFMQAAAALDAVALPPALIPADSRLPGLSLS